MDSIKIRVWDFDDKRMIYLDERAEIVYSGYGNFKLVLGSPFHDDYWRGNVSSYKLMLWIGLQDKHGKDVYAGDIIREENGDIWAIRWNRELAQFALYFHDDTKIGSNKEWRYEDSLGSLVISVYEVIGNMYENPDLLEHLTNG